MAKKKYIQLPRGYISYTQVALWKSNPTRYKEIYFNDRKNNVMNDFIAYGKDYADALEQESETGDLLTDASILILKKYDVRDKEIVAEIKTKDGWIRLLGKPDTLNSKTFEFREYKTGKNPWTQSKCDKHFQLPFYGVLVYLKYGVFLKDCYLDWIQTEKVAVDSVFLDVDHKVQPTGMIRSFRVELGTRKILETVAEIIKVAKEIELAYAAH